MIFIVIMMMMTQSVILFMLLGLYEHIVVWGQGVVGVFGLMSIVFRWLFFAHRVLWPGRPSKLKNTALDCCIIT